MSSNFDEEVTKFWSEIWRTKAQFLTGCDDLVSNCRQASIKFQKLYTITEEMELNFDSWKEGVEEIWHQASVKPIGRQDRLESFTTLVPQKIFSLPDAICFANRVIFNFFNQKLQNPVKSNLKLKIQPQPTVLNKKNSSTVRKMYVFIHIFFQPSLWQIIIMTIIIVWKKSISS